MLGAMTDPPPDRLAPNLLGCPPGIRRHDDAPFPGFERTDGWIPTAERLPESL